MTVSLRREPNFDIFISFLKECTLSVVIFRASQMLVGKVGNLASARGTLDESLFYEVGFVDLFDGSRILAEGGGNGTDAHRAALELVDDDT